jgi:TPR repeat protein
MLRKARTFSLCSTQQAPSPRQNQVRVSSLQLFASRGLADAQYQLGRLYLMGAEIQNPSEGEKNLELAAQQGHEEASKLRQARLNLRKDKFMADLGDADAMIRLGIAFCNGSVTKLNTENGLKYLKRSADFGHPVGQYYYGLHSFLNGGQIEEAASFMQKAYDNDMFLPDLRLDAALQLGLIYHRLSKMKKAEQILQWPAEEGNADAQFYYASAAKDPKIKMQYLKLAAEKDHLPALNALGSLYFSRRDFEEGSKYYERAADLGDGTALMAIGHMYQREKPKNIKKANSYFIRATETEDFGGDAEFQLGKNFLLSDVKDLNLATFYLKNASEQNVAFAEYFLGCAQLEKGKYLRRPVRLDSDNFPHFEIATDLAKNPLDHTEAMKCFKKSALKGNQKSNLLLAKIYYYNEKYIEAFQCISKTTNNPNEHILLTKMVFINDKDTFTVDTKKAIKYLETVFDQAVKINNQDLIDEVGLYLGKAFINNDTEKSQNYLRHVNFPEAYHLLSLIHFRLEEDFTIAFKYCKKAAEGGFVEAFRNLGECYKNGVGTDRDLEKGVHWLKSSGLSSLDRPNFRVEETKSFGNSVLRENLEIE